jgi:flagellar biosynthetic protein FliO
MSIWLRFFMLSAAFLSLSFSGLSFAEEDAPVEDASSALQEPVEEGLAEPDAAKERIYGNDVETAEPSESEDNQFQGLFAQNSSPMGMFLTFIGFFVVFGAAIVAVWVLFKKGFFGKSFGNKEGKLKVVESRMLGNRQYLMVVEYEDNKILLGVGPGKIDYLTSLSGFRDEFPSAEAQIDKKSIEEIV